MIINRQNYERYFLDYLEGRLDDQLMSEMADFLDRNPDLFRELELGLGDKIPANAESFPHKESLQRNVWDKPGITTENLDEWIIASLERDLPEKQKEVLDRYLENHPEKQRDYYLFSRVILEADKRILFPRKDSLRKAMIRIPSVRLWPYVAAAASILILMILYFVVPNPLRQNTTSLGQVTISSPGAVPKPMSKGPQTNNPQKEIPVTPSFNHEVTANKTFLVQASGSKNPWKIEKQQMNMDKQESSIEVKRQEIMATITYLQHELPTIIIEPAHQPLAMPSVKKAKPHAEDEYLTVKQLAITEFKKEVLQEKPGELNRDKLTLWDIANAGLQGVNKITGWNMALETSYNPEGDLDNLAFNSKLLNISHSAKK